MLKTDIRKTYLDKRKSFSKQEIEEFSQSISDSFFDVFEPKNEKIHCFLPILSKNEINTNIIIQRLFSETDCSVITSKSDFSTLEMKHFVINEQTQFEEDHYGIPSPVNAQEIGSFEIDWVVVPLICFDSRGFRVGYGKGFYDRFIVRCRSDIKIIGLSIFNPIERVSDINEFDKPLDFCITPNTVHHFKQ